MRVFHTKQLPAVLWSAVGVALLVFLSALLPPERPLPVRGGSYRGVVPGIGSVQLDLYLGGQWDLAWLRAGDDGVPIKLALRKTNENFAPPETFTWNAEWVVFDAEQWLTNATFVLSLAEEGKSLEGRVRLARTGADSEFALPRNREFVAIRMLGRADAKRRFDGWLPRRGDGDAFGRSVFKLALAQTQKSALAFVGSRPSRPHDLDLFRWPIPPEAHNALEVWQPRLQSEQIHSYAIWSVEDAGPSRNLARWRSLNAWRNGGRAMPFSLAELFDPSTPWQDFVRNACHQQLTQRTGNGGAVQISTLSSELDYQAFALSDTGLEFYFGARAEDGRRNGSQIVRIEYSALRPFFAHTGPAATLREQTQLSSAR